LRARRFDINPARVIAGSYAPIGVFGEVMASRSNTRPFFQNPDRRFFLRALASLGLTARTGKSERKSETVYRFLTPEYEVQMSVQYFGNSLTKDFRFRDRLTNRAFCLSANGEENRNCLPRFSGSMAIAHYHFRPHLRSHIPLNLRERVLTIDHDSRMNPRPPFERVLAVEREVVSDIQAFGHNRDDPEEAASGATSLALWCLLRQDLYLNQEAAPFLIVHWKHTLNFISLVDVIPGDRTELIIE
jgi:hypothetical protein